MQRSREAADSAGEEKEEEKEGKPVSISQLRPRKDDEAGR